MNRWILVFSLAVLSTPASASMIRAAGAVDRQTILLEGGATLRLRGVDLPIEDEPAAREHLNRLVAGLWLYVENGEVYRSPDALFVNGEMMRRPWDGGTKMTYLGESFPAPPSRASARTPAAPARVRAPRPPSRRTSRGAGRAPKASRKASSRVRKR